jgi:hypothetical protein
MRPGVGGAARPRGIRVLAAAALALSIGLLAVTGSRAETVRQGDLIVSFGGSISPPTLPRAGTAPVGVEVSGRVRSSAGGPPASLRRIALEVNRAGVLDRRGLPVCPLGHILPTSTARALATCGPALVGEGRVRGVIVLPEQPATAFEGRVVAFNGRLPNGHPAILAHLYTVRPAPITFVLAFAIEPGRGQFGTRLVATVPPDTRHTAHITSFTLDLHREFTADGVRHSYLSAGCPAPAGFPGATFPLVRASYSFVGGKTLSSTLTRTCHVGG